jgi:hypothetical protein
VNGVLGTWDQLRQDDLNETEMAMLRVLLAKVMKSRVIVCVEE